jgi:hypothetical protein
VQSDHGSPVRVSLGIYPCGRHAPVPHVLTGDEGGKDAKSGIVSLEHHSRVSTFQRFTQFQCLDKTTLAVPNYPRYLAGVPVVPSMVTVRVVHLSGHHFSGTSQTSIELFTGHLASLWLRWKPRGTSHPQPMAPTGRIVQSHEYEREREHMSCSFPIGLGFFSASNIHDLAPIWGIHLP